MIGRPSKFTEALAETILRLYSVEKMTDEQVAAEIGVSVRSLKNWRGKYPDFLHAVNKAKGIADALVEASLFERAIGYSHAEEKIFCDKYGSIVRAKTTKQYPPDTRAIQFWLKNRQPRRWKDKTEIDLNDLTKLTDEQLKARIAAHEQKRKADDSGE